MPVGALSSQSQMAQTKRKRRTKHRGNAAGTVEVRGRTGRPPTPEERKKQDRAKRAQARTPKPPTWKGALKKAGLATGFIFVFLLITNKFRVLPALVFADPGDAALHPVGLLPRRLPVPALPAKAAAAAVIDARMFTVGPVQENAYIVRLPDADRAVMIDPGDEAERLIGALEALGITTVEAILLTHTHFDHVGAVAPVARATGAPVYCPELETHILADINGHMRLPGLRPLRELRRR